MDYARGNVSQCNCSICSVNGLPFSNLALLFGISGGLWSRLTAVFLNREEREGTSNKSI